MVRMKGRGSDRIGPGVKEVRRRLDTVDVLAADLEEVHVICVRTAGKVVSEW